MSDGRPITLSLFSSRSMSTTSNAELKSKLAMPTYSSPSRALAIIDCNWIPNVAVLLFFLIRVDFCPLGLCYLNFLAFEAVKVLVF